MCHVVIGYFNHVFCFSLVGLCHVTCIVWYIDLMFSFVSCRVLFVASLFMFLHVKPLFTVYLLTFGYH